VAAHMANASCDEDQGLLRNFRPLVSERNVDLVGFGAEARPPVEVNHAVSKTIANQLKYYMAYLAALFDQNLIVPNVQEEEIS
jgi:hypothetical protein